MKKDDSIFTGKCDKCRHRVRMSRRMGKTIVRCPHCGPHIYGTPLAQAMPEEPKRLINL